MDQPIDVERLPRPPLRKDSDLLTVREAQILAQAYADRVEHTLRAQHGELATLVERTAATVNTRFQGVEESFRNVSEAMVNDRNDALSTMVHNQNYVLDLIESRTLRGRLRRLWRFMRTPIESLIQGD